MNNQPIQMTFSELFRPELQQLIGRIAQTPMAGHKSYEVGKIARTYKQALQKARETYQALTKDIIEFNADGTPEYNFDEKTGEGSLKFKEGFSEKSEEFLSKVKEWEKEVVDFECRPWDITILSEIKLSAMDFETLGKLFVYEAAPSLQVVK